MFKKAHHKSLPNVDKFGVIRPPKCRIKLAQIVNIKNVSKSTAKVRLSILLCLIPVQITLIDFKDLKKSNNSYYLGDPPPPQPIKKRNGRDQINPPPLKITHFILGSFEVKKEIKTETMSTQKCQHTLKRI